MRHDTFRICAPCPSCGSVRPLLACTSWEESGGPRRTSVSECPRCWNVRAAALGAIRADLRASDDLSQTSGGRPTWQGAPLMDQGADPLEAAVASALMRRGLRRVRRAHVVPQVRRHARELTLVGA